eukprot:scaffold82897_cov23-Tisochrysis_lutea.AAC.1
MSHETVDKFTDESGLVNECALRITLCRAGSVSVALHDLQAIRRSFGPRGQYGARSKPFRLA